MLSIGNGSNTADNGHTTNYVNITNNGNDSTIAVHHLALMCLPQHPNSIGEKLCQYWQYYQCWYYLQDSEISLHHLLCTNIDMFANINNQWPIL